MVPISAASGITLHLFEDEPRFNLTLLELLRLGRAGVSQDGVFGEMVLEPRSGENAEGDLEIDGYA